MPNTYKPTDAMASAAKRGLKMREGQPPSNRGGTSVGLSRASQLKNKEGLSLDTVKRMYSFFSRHEVDKQSESWKKGSSKGEQAWLLWGGDAGYSWSKSIVEKEKKASNSDNESQQSEYSKMSKVMCNVLTQVNANNVFRDDKRGEIILKNVCPIRDDVVMNGGIYKDEDIESSYRSIEDTLAPLGHPTDINGNYISAKSGQAIQNFYVGAVNRNVVKRGKDVLMDIVINIDQAKGSMRGPEMLDRIQYMETSREPIHVSTGLMLSREDAVGTNADGDEYDWIARNMEFDHVAILIDEPGAATPDKGVGIFANALGDKEAEVMFCNLAVLSNEDEGKGDKFTDKLIDKLAKTRIEGNNNNHANFMPSSQEEDGDMKKDIIAQLLAANCGKSEAELNAMSDSEIGSLVGNAMKMSKETAMDVNGRMDKMTESMKNMGEDMKKGMEDMGNRMSDMEGKYNAMYDGAKKEQEAKMNSLIANAAKSLGVEEETLKGTPEAALLAMTKNSGQSYSINSSFSAPEGEEAFSTEIPD